MANLHFHLRTCVQHVYNMCTTCVQHVYNMCTTCVQHVYNMCTTCVQHVTCLHQTQALTASTAQGRPCRANIYSVDQEITSFVEGGSFFLC